MGNEIVPQYAVSAAFSDGLNSAKERMIELRESFDHDVSISEGLFLDKFMRMCLDSLATVKKEKLDRDRSIQKWCFGEE